MSNRKLLALGLLIPMGIAASLPAFAQDDAAPEDAPMGPRGQMGAILFEDLDLDGDGALTLEEMQSRERGPIARADTDGDGAVSRDELIAQAMEQATARIDRMMEAVDGDGDGVLTEAEFDAAREARAAERRQAMAERMFEHLDADGDGAVSEEEFAAAAEQMGERFGPGGMRGHGGEGRHGMDMHEGGHGEGHGPRGPFNGFFGHRG